MKKILSLLALTALTIGLLGSCCKKEDPKVPETKTMAEILKTATGIPESQNMTPPANAWVNSTDSDCKAFIGVDAAGDKLFVILKGGLESAPLKICMDDAFARIDDNTYQRVESGVGTFTIQMAEGKFTSYKFEAVSGSAYEQFNGTYSAPAASIAFDENPFEPGNIKARQTLTIKGKNLDLVTKVVFCDNVEVTNFKSQSSEQIVIENFPPKARTGKVTLVNGTTSQEVTSDVDLVVAQPSVSEIYQFTEVTPKQKLTINGENFDLVCDAIIGDDVYLDYNVSNEGHTIEIEMPEEVHDDTVKVIACSGVEVTVATVTAAGFLPAGALKGVFSVSADKKVHFSQGNLTYDISASTNKWKFYEHQFDCAANGDASSTLISLFTWGYSASTSLNPTGTDYVTDHTTDGDKLVYDKASSEGGDDWGVAYCESNNIAVGIWRTLSKDEWTYLFDTRTVNNGTKEGKSYQRATINSDATSVYGMILYPDNYTSQTGATSYTSTEWTTMEENGCVFLPAAGYRNGSNVSDVGDGGYYWSSTAYGSPHACLVYFDSDDLGPDYGDNRYDGGGVRLVTEVPAPGSTIEDFNKKNDDPGDWN